MKIKNLPEDIQPYLEDSSNFKEGSASKVFIPENEKEVLEVLKQCVATKTPVTISAAGTGNVAARIPLDGVVLSTEKLDKIISIDKKNKKACLQSGVVVANFLKELEPLDLFYPPFPTERTAFIGGNVATNASGEYSFRFGPTRQYVQKIRMALTTGDILEIRRGEIFEKNGYIDYGLFKIALPSYQTPDVKCSAGYYSKKAMDAIDLIIGSEGTLGVITEVEVNLIDKLPERFIILIFLKETANIPEVVKKIKSLTYELNIFSLEFFDEKSLEFLKDEFSFIPKNKVALYIEAEKSNLEKWFSLIESFSPLDVFVSESKTDYQKLIHFRYKLPDEINSYFKKLGCTKIAVDASVPEGKFEEFYNYYKNILYEYKNIEMVLFGHIGESHLHFNMFPKTEEEKKICEEIYISSIKKAISLGGSGFAEHGIGKVKSKYLPLMYGEKAIYEMAQIKKTFDPPCILGLDNIFSRNYLV